LLLRSVKTQFRLMVNKRNFWVAIFLGLFYCIISYAHSLYIYRGYDVSGTLNAASLFIGNADTALFEKYFLIYVSVCGDFTIFIFLF
jgi:hypothetical protein